MKTIKVAVNKSEQRPAGVEIEVVEPENNLEQRVLGYLLTGFVNNARRQGNLRVEVPENFSVEYQREGSFVLLTGPQAPNLSGPVPTYYTPPQAKAVLAIHAVGNRFDVVYGEVKPRTPAPGNAASTSGTPETAETPTPTESKA